MKVNLETTKASLKTSNVGLELETPKASLKLEMPKVSRELETLKARREGKKTSPKTQEGRGKARGASTEKQRNVGRPTNG